MSQMCSGERLSFLATMTRCMIGEIIVSEKNNIPAVKHGCSSIILWAVVLVVKWYWYIS